MDGNCIICSTVVVEGEGWTESGWEWVGAKGMHTDLPITVSLPAGLAVAQNAMLHQQVS
jgi:hypothetical protein